MYIIIYDFGTSSVKTCLFNIDSEIHIVANSTADYGIYISENGGAEQDTEEWWEAICSTTRALFFHSEVKPDEIEGIAFCSQMLADITGRTIETVDHSQEVGAIGTALVVAAGIRGADVLELSRQLVKANRAYTPNPENGEVYERNHKVFKKLYHANASNFRELNSGRD